MDKRRVAAAPFIAALAVGSMAIAGSAQEPTEAADDAATAKSATGTISRETDTDGRVTYLLTPLEGEPIELSYGPPWFWGEASPLEGLVGQSVTVEGQLRDGAPNDDATDTAQTQAAQTPAMRVLRVDGEPLREKGRPPWAGGPKVLGDVHPGFEGWSEGQAARAAEQAAKPDQAKNAGPPAHARGGKPDATEA